MGMERQTITRIEIVIKVIIINDDFNLLVMQIAVHSLFSAFLNHLQYTDVFLVTSRRIKNRFFLTVLTLTILQIG